MSDKEKHLLFVTILCLIILVNLTLSYGLFSHFVLGRKVDEINWLLGVFAAEFVGCTVLAWRKLINLPDPPACPPMVIEKSAVSEDAEDAGVVLKEMGRRYLIRARDLSLGLEARKKYARRAIEIFAQIPKGDQAYLSAMYDTATAYRILGEFDKAVNAYKCVKRLVRESGARYNTRERHLWDADVVMMIGIVYKDQGLLEQAEGCFFNAWKRDPNNLVRMLNLHEITSKQGKFEDARIWADMLSKHPDYSPSIAHVVEEQEKAVSVPHGGKDVSDG